MPCRRLPLFLVAVLAAACGAGDGSPDNSAVAARAVELSAPVTSLQQTDVKVGEGELAVEGREVTVHYTGTLMEGTKFDSSRDRQEPFTFRLGAGQVIPGWDEGVKGMRVGGVRQLTIPARMAYGANGFPPTIPPNAALKFEIELLRVE